MKVLIPLYVTVMGISAGLIVGFLFFGLQSNRVFFANVGVDLKMDVFSILDAGSSSLDDGTTNYRIFVRAALAASALVLLLFCAVVLLCQTALLSTGAGWAGPSATRFNIAFMFFLACVVDISYLGLEGNNLFYDASGTQNTDVDFDYDIHTSKDWWSIFGALLIAYINFSMIFGSMIIDTELRMLHCMANGAVDSHVAAYFSKVTKDSYFTVEKQSKEDAELPSYDDSVDGTQKKKKNRK